MDKLRNILNPGKNQDDEVLYGDSSKAHTNPGVVAGQGSHFPSSTQTTSDDTTSTTAVRDGIPGSAQNTGSGLTGGSSTTAGPHSSNIENELDPRVDSNRDGYNATGTTGGATSTAGPHSSNVANKADPRVDSDLDGSRTVGGNTTNQASGSGYTGNTQTTAGPHDSNLLNKLDPRVDSDRDGSTTVGNTTSGSGTGTYGGTSTGLGAEHSQNVGSNIGTSSTTTPHSSSLANRVDPRVDTTGTSTTDSSLTGIGHSNRHAGVGAGAGVGAAGVAYETEHHRGHEHHGHHGHHGHHEQNLTNPSDDRHYGRDAGIGAAGAGAAYEAEKHHHDQAGTTTGTTTGTTGTSTTTGPHSSNLLNKLDPRVDSTTGSSNTAGLGPNAPSSDFDANAGGQVGPHPYHTRAGAVLDPHGPGSVSGFGGSSGTEYSPNTSGRGNLQRDAALTETGASTGTTSTSTAGPHSSSLLNKLDPRVDSTATGNNTLTDTSDSNRSHLSRDAALATGAGGVGYEAEKHHERATDRSGLAGSTGTTGTSGMTTTTGTTGTTATTGVTDSSTTAPHSSSLLNRLDPRVDTSNTTSGTTGQTDSNVGRDAGLATAAGGVGYEAEKHHHHTTNTGLGTSGSSAAGATGDTGLTDYSTTGLHGSDLSSANTTAGTTGSSRLGRDTALAGTAGTGATIAEKHHESVTGSGLAGHDSSMPLGATTGSGIGNTSQQAGTTSTSAAGEPYLTGPVHNSSLLNKLDPRVKKVTPEADGSGVLNQGTVGSDNPYNATAVDSRLGGSQTTGSVGSTTDHHYGRDAALGAGAIGAGYEAEKHHGSLGTTAGPHSSDLANKVDPRVDSDLDGSRTVGGTGTTETRGEHHDHLARDGAVATGAAGVAEHEHHKHEHHHDGQRNRLHKDPSESVKRELEEEFRGGGAGGATSQQPGTMTDLKRDV